MSTPATGLEPVTPVSIDTVSVTDLAAFRKDRLAWFLGTVHRLEAPGSEVYLRFGTAMHAALAVYHDPETADKDRTARMLDVFQGAWIDVENAARAEWGFLWVNIAPLYDEHYDLGHDMLLGYAAADAGASVISDYEPLGTARFVERRFTVPIPGTDGHLTGKIDMGAENHRGFGAVDHKNLSGTHSAEALDTDEQLTAYAWIMRELGEPVDWVAYNVLLKKAPLTKSGKPTTSRLFTRDFTYRADAQLDVFGRILKEQWQDMRDAAENPEYLYPSPPSASGYAPKSGVWSIERAILLGDDVADVIRNGYVVGDPRE